MNYDDEYITCDGCGGKGYKVCYACDGKGTQSWEEIDDDGNLIRGNDICPRCDGTGFIDCTRCWSKGKRRNFF